LKPNLLAGLIALSLAGCMTPAVLRDPSTGEIVQCLATGAFPIINQQQCIAAHEDMGWIRTTGAEARRASQQQLAQRNTEVTAAIEECRGARMRGELKSYAEAAQCTNVRIRAVNQSASYPFMDLVDLAAAVRLADAEKVDKHQMSEAEAALHVAQVKSQLIDQARRRILEAKAVDIQARTAQTQADALEVQARAAQAEAQAAQEQVRLQERQLQMQSPQSTLRPPIICQQMGSFTQCN